MAGLGARSQAEEDHRAPELRRRSGLIAWIVAGLAVALLLAVFFRWNQTRAAAEARATDALIGAVSRWDVQEVKKQLLAGADPNAGMGGRIALSSLQEMLRVLLHRQSRYRGPSVLSQSVARPEMVQALLEAGADPNSPLDRSDPALHMGVFMANVRSCALLLDHGAKMEARDSQGMTALLKALSYGQKEPVARLLFERGADPRKRLSTGSDALMLAAACGDVASVQACLLAGLSPSTTNKQGLAPLHFASLGGHAHVVRVLLSRGVPVNAVDKNGTTPLILACSNGFTDVAGLLLDKGADATLSDPSGSSPMHSAILASQQGIIPLLDKLRSLGADPSARDTRGMTPMHLVVRDALSDRVDWLLKNGASVGARDNLGQTPLHIAAATVGEFSNIGCIKRLLAAGADVNARDKLGVTPLLAAVSATQQSSDRDEVVALLLSRGASTTLADASGTTPLTFAQRLRKTQRDLARRLGGLLLKRTPKRASRGISGEAP